MFTFTVGETGEGQSPTVGHDVSNLRRCVWHRLAQNVPCVHDMAGTEHYLLTVTSTACSLRLESQLPSTHRLIYEGWNFNSGNYLFTTDTK